MSDDVQIDEPLPQTGGQFARQPDGSLVTLQPPTAPAEPPAPEEDPPPEGDLPQPEEGGSYLRQDDGSLTPIEPEPEGEQP